MSNKTSVKSTALEQRVSLGQDGFGPWLMQIITRYGLLLLTSSAMLGILGIVVFIMLSGYKGGK